MMTPRSVSLHNKNMMVHVRFNARKITLKLDNKDMTVDQLKQRIRGELGEELEKDMVLIVNGKPCTSRGDVTLAQAKIMNGSKILIQTSDQNSSRGGGDDRTESNERDYSQHTTTDSSQHTINQLLSQIESKGLEISRTVKQLEQTSEKLKENSYRNQSLIQEMKNSKKCAAMQGELLMQNFESLDKLSLSESMTDLKKKRKLVANLLNSILDRNDQVLATFSEYLKTAES